MARTKGTGEKSPVVKAFDAAKKAHDTAVENHTKQATATNKTAMEGAAKKLVDAKEAVKRERFLRVTVTRAEKAADAIENVGKAFAPVSYSYTKEEAGEVVDVLMARAKALQNTVATILAGTKETKEEKGSLFSFVK